MSTTPSTGFKALMGVLVVLLLVLGYFTYNLYQDKQSNEARLEEEKQMVMDDLSAMSAKYDLAIKENEIQNDELVNAKYRIDGLLDSLKISEANAAVLRRYRSKYQQLQKEMDLLMAQNDSLKVANNQLTSDLDSTKVQLADRTALSDSLLVQNTELANVVKDASVLGVASLKGFGVIERNSGKLVETDKANRSDKIRVCFTVTKNKLVGSGDKELFVQVIDPKNNVVGVNEQISFDDGTTLNYSTISRFLYESANLDICEFVKPRGEFEKGRYVVNVFNQNDLVGTSSFNLK